MSKGIMPNNLKEDIAHKLGVYDIVKNEGWGSVSSKNCGNIVKMAIEITNGNYR